MGGNDIPGVMLASAMRHADRYGLTPASPQFSFRQVMARVHDVVRAAGQRPAATAAAVATRQQAPAPAAPSAIKNIANK